MERPLPERVDPELAGDELTQLTQFLDYHRATLVRKASGLTAEQRASTVGASTLTLAGLVHHAALNEDSWFGVVLLDRPKTDWWADAPWDDDPDWEMTTAPDLDFDLVLDRYEQACARSRANVAEAYAAGGLGVLSKGQNRRGETFNLRWILLHMIEETARHNGHADFLREAADGATGE
jgi:uncharacterized damage-inducible protein DinB